MTAPTLQKCRQAAYFKDCFHRKEHDNDRSTQHQSALIKWSQLPQIRERYPELKLLHHIPNGGKRDPIEAKHLKAQGVKPGVPDLCLPVARGNFHGLYIEMKTETGRPSDNQKWWIKELNDQKYKAVICHGWEEAKKCLTDYLS